jgi:outer membrane protein TolC
MKKIFSLILVPAFSFALTMDEAVEKAVKDNLYLKQKEIQIKIDRVGLKEDYQLWMPQFFANYSYTIFKDTPYTNIPANPPFPSISFKQFDKQFSNFEVGINYPLFTGFQRINKIKASKIQINIDKDIYSEEKIKLIGTVKKAYLDALSAREVLDIYIKQKEAVELSLKQAQEFHKQGLVSKVDVLQAKVKLAEVERNIKKAEGNLKIAIANLNNLLNQNLDKEIKLEKVDIKIPENLNLLDLEKQALKNRNIIKALHKTEKQLDYYEEIQKGQFFPKIVAQGKYTYTDQYPYLDPKGNFSASIALTVNFQGIKPYYSALKIKEEKSQLNLKIMQLENDIKLQVKNAYENFLVAEKNLQIAKSSLSEAKEYYEMVKEQYKNQLASMTDLLNAESYYTSAKNSEVVSYYQLLKALTDLETAVGGKLYEK